MRKTTSKRSFFISLSAIVLMSAVLLFTYAVPSFSADAAVDSDKGKKIRQPKDNQSLEAFWDQFDWKDLNPVEQDAWKKLGWDKASWDEESNIPVSEKKKWKELSEGERAAAGQLGYDEKSWDATLCDTKK